MSNPSKQVFEYRGPRIFARYNQFYSPNLCHVCKSRNEGYLITCDWCKLISYCSYEHKMEHDLEHQEVCTTISSLLEVCPEVCKDEFSNWQQWKLSRLKLFQTIGHYNRRPMQHYEKQMIVWPKSCIVCYRQSAALQTCEKCFSVNYCNEHISAFHTKHDETICALFTLSLNIDIGFMSNEDNNISYSFLPSVKKDECMETMLEFYIEYVLISRQDFDLCTKDYMQSDYLSGPLTVYSGLKRNSLLQIIQQETVIIYIIGRFFIDGLSLTPWEILLHLLPELRKLIVIKIDPKLECEFCIHSLCELCTNKQKTLISISVPTLFHDLIIKRRLYNKPNVTISYHADHYTDDAWLKSVEIILHKYCPLFLTYISEEKAKQHVIMTHKTLTKNAKIIFNGNNNFSGLSPGRCIYTDNMYFVNEYLIIYKGNERNVSSAIIAS